MCRLGLRLAGIRLINHGNYTKPLHILPPPLVLKIRNMPYLYKGSVFEYANFSGVSASFFSSPEAAA
jgi:hypothetical protein